jgi:hypothetical protein
MHVWKTVLLQSKEVNNAVYILYVMAKRVGDRMRQPREKCPGNQHCFDEEC